MLMQFLIIATILICTASLSGQSHDVISVDVQEDFDYLNVKIDPELPASLSEEDRFSLHQTVALARSRQCKTARCRQRMLQNLVDAYPYLLKSAQIPVAQHSPAEQHFEPTQDGDTHDEL